MQVQGMDQNSFFLDTINHEAIKSRAGAQHQINLPGKDAMLKTTQSCTCELPYVGKFWQIWQTVGNSPKFSPPIFINARVFNKLPTDSPNFSSPKTLEPLIRQNFPTPKFSHIQ